MPALNERAAAALASAYAEIMAWRQGLNHRSISRAKAGATYCSEPAELKRLADELLQGGC